VEYGLLKFFHLLGAVLMGGGLIGVWMADLRSRQLHELKPFSEAVRNIAVFYDGLVVPGALLLLASGTWMIVEFYGGWNFLQFPTKDVVVVFCWLDCGNCACDNTDACHSPALSLGFGSVARLGRGRLWLRGRRSPTFNAMSGRHDRNVPRPELAGLVIKARKSSLAALL
jgi:hypothetical protein